MRISVTRTQARWMLAILLIGLPSLLVACRTSSEIKTVAWTYTRGQIDHASAVASSLSSKQLSDKERIEIMRLHDYADGLCVGASCSTLRIEGQTVREASVDKIHGVVIILYDSSGAEIHRSQEKNGSVFPLKLIQEVDSAVR